MAEIPIAIAITKDNLFVQVHANIYNLINNRSNVSNPADSTGERKFVYTREPNFNGRDFQGFPCIIIPYAEYSQNEKTADNSKAYTSDKFEIIVYTQDKISDSQGNPSGARQMADILTNIIETLNNLSNSATLRNNGMKNKNFTSVVFEYGKFDGKPLFRGEIPLYFRQLRVIA